MTNVLDQEVADRFSAYRGDCVDVMRGMPEGAVDLTVSSIPFQSIFTYSNSDRDFGNSRSPAQFFDQFAFFVRELLRVTKPGRIAAIHCMVLPTSKVRDGEIGLTDFRGDTIRAFRDAGWIYHAETVIWKDPVTAMQRTKALGLLWKQLRKDSAMSRMGIPDTVCFFRKPGENPQPITHTKEDFKVSQWQQWASPVWMDIDQTETLQARSVREHDDERHLCPLQTEVIRRCLVLYSNPGDVVFDPFGGIGSTGVVALQNDRRAVIAELKESYFKQAVANLAGVQRKQTSIFDAIATVGGAP